MNYDSSDKRRNVMGHSGIAQSAKLSADEVSSLQAAYSVCSAAEQFFRYAATQVANSNLRYKFLQLTKLHLNAAQRLAQTCATADTISQQRSTLSTVKSWYQHQAATLAEQSTQHTMLAELAALLQQQIRSLRQLTAGLHNREIKIELAQLVAELQICSDQLQPLLKVLPPSRK
ncbi:hypothetical protein [Rheinheimera muenzenbergensis]